MMVTDIPCLGLLSPRKLQLFGADANVTEIPRVVCAPDDEFAVVSALVQHLKSHSTDWDFVSWRGLSDTEPVRNLVGAENMIPSASTPDYYLTPTEDFKSSLPRNVKESLRKCYNSLKRDNHEFEFRVVKDVETVDEALETFFRLHASRAAREDTIAHRDNFAIGRARAFLSSYIRAAAAEGHVQVFQLVINRQVVATRIGFVFGTHLYLYFSGYLPEWGKYSVMTTTVWETIQYAIRSGYKVVNLSPGTDVSKTRWRPQEANFSSVTWIAPSIRGPVAHQGFTSLNNLAHKPLFARGLHQIRLDN
jgi:CelD/BcsL family acetyltransferase involved in cellulose biosynthesis